MTILIRRTIMPGDAFSIFCHYFTLILLSIFSFITPTAPSVFELCVLEAECDI